MCLCLVRVSRYRIQNGWFYFAIQVPVHRRPLVGFLLRLPVALDIMSPCLRNSDIVSCAPACHIWQLSFSSDLVTIRDAWSEACARVLAFRLDFLQLLFDMWVK